MARYYDDREDRRNFKVYINQGEMDQIHKWVLMKDNIETGGNLFGLWIGQHTAVVQFVLGPGEDCRRTSTSFHQDVNCLEMADKYLTKLHGLCNIGQWHSHRRIPLSGPSAGDEDTVWSNMSKHGLSRCIVFIATIKGDQQGQMADINCFLFEVDDGGQLPVLRGSFCDPLLNGDSPFRLDKRILQRIRKGAESIHDVKEQRIVKHLCEKTVSSDNGHPKKLPRLKEGKTLEETMSLRLLQEGSGEKVEWDLLQTKVGRKDEVQKRCLDNSREEKTSEETMFLSSLQDGPGKGMEEVSETRMFRQ